MEVRSDAGGGVTALQLTNAHSEAIRFYLEPWGEEYTMPSGATFEVVARGPQGGSLDVAVADDAITIWGWAGSVVALLHEGTLLGPPLDGRTPVPVMAEGEERSAPSVGAAPAVAGRPDRR